MKKEYILVCDQTDVERAIEYLKKQKYTISFTREQCVIDNWDSIDGLYGDPFSKTISVVVSGQPEPHGYENIFLI